MWYIIHWFWVFRFFISGVHTLMRLYNYHLENVEWEKKERTEEREMKYRAPKVENRNRFVKYLHILYSEQIATPVLVPFSIQLTFRIVSLLEENERKTYTHCCYFSPPPFSAHISFMLIKWYWHWAKRVYPPPLIFLNFMII